MIKYHANGVDEREYGADHCLTNNWNPDKEYADNEYARVYFRMETKGYCYPSFSFTDEDRNAFDKEIIEAFSSIGWNCEESAYNGCCATWRKGYSSLYLHPQNFSGYVKKSEIKRVAEAVATCNAFTLRWVDLYETAYDLDDAQLEEYLSKQDIRGKVLQGCKTKRTNLFFSYKTVLYNLTEKYNKVRVNCDKRHSFTQDPVVKKYMDNLLNTLIEEGYLVLTENNSGEKLIRTINKTEAKQKKLNID